VEFTAVDSAVDWLKRHRTAILVGSVVVIAGVVFVTVSAGAGAVVLAPIALVVVASSVPHLEPQFVEVSP
jgi:flavin reductase (DIM6/NTAB) family NADH-FMN oxidoreductase RutF